jgi:hypothetical protein
MNTYFWKTFLENFPGKLPNHAKGLQISTPEAVLQRLVKTRKKRVTMSISPMLVWLQLSKLSAKCVPTPFLAYARLDSPPADGSTVKQEHE